MTFIGTVNAITYVGAEPIFFDCDKNTWQIDTNLVKVFLEKESYIKNNKCYYKKTNQKIAAILPVHILGHSIQIDEIISLGNKYKIPVIEDAAESFGSKFKKEF